MTALGHVLGVNYKSIAVYSEAIIRSNIIFHLSNLLEKADCYISAKLKLPPFVVVSAGTTTGSVKFAKSCEALMSSGGAAPGPEKAKSGPDTKPTIAFVEEVFGDEEFPEKVKGMILQREIPLLSHLAIRIRQSGAVCCACKNVVFYNKLKGAVREEQQVQLIVSPEIVDLKQMQAHMSGPQLEKSEAILSSIERVPVDFSVKFLITSATEAQKMSSCIGSKSYNAFVLEGLAEKHGGKFKTPKSCCLPYGALGHILKLKTPEDDSTSMPLSGTFAQLDCAEDGQMIDKFHALLLEQVTIRLEQEFARKVVEEYAGQIKAQFGASAKLIAIRSSSNMEDLKKLSGAGLFDSILNIPSNDEAAVCDAIKGVWKSLYSRRAVQSRIKYRLKQEIAAMAVLVQEMIFADYSFIIHTANPVPSFFVSLFFEKFMR